jgi:hypothetical protein
MTNNTFWVNNRAPQAENYTNTNTAYENAKKAVEKLGEKHPKEARIILATEQQNNTPIHASIRDLLREKLARAFGGYTETTGNGGYIMENGDYLKQETVLIYDVAMEGHHYPALTAIAQWLAMVANQECVYVRRPDGEVMFYSRSQ